MSQRSGGQFISVVE